MGHLSGVFFGGGGVKFVCLFVLLNDPLICSQFVSFGSIMISTWVSKDGKEPVLEIYWCLSTRGGNCEHIFWCVKVEVLHYSRAYIISSDFAPFCR